MIGTTYGGDGKTTFALPDFGGRAAVHQGTGTGLSTYTLGQTGGAPAVPLTEEDAPYHTHPINCNGSVSNQGSPVNNIWGPEPTGQSATYSSQEPDFQLCQLDTTGTGTPHQNYQPYMALYVCIALQGTVPVRTTPSASLGDGGN